MTLTNYVATKDLFQALIRAKRGVRPTSVSAPPVPTGESFPVAGANEGDGPPRTG